MGVSRRCLGGRSTGRRVGAASLSAAALFGVLAGSGCAGVDADISPFYVGRVHETERGTESRVISLGPFWDDSRTPDRRETGLHPLWHRVATPDETRVQVLAPLFAWRWTNDESSFRFIVLSWAKTHRAKDTAPDSDFMFFPFFWWGNGTTEQEKYFAFFPLFGTIKDFAAFAEVSFFLFPLYYTAKKEITSPETFYNITPLIGWVDGGPRDGSWRVLPLFGHWKYEGKYDKWSLLWPILHWQTNRLDTDDPSRLVSVWPLFGIESSRRMNFFTFLWPFFRFRTERVVKSGADGMPTEEIYFQHDVFWPLFRSQHTEEFDRLRLFPFFSRYRSPELDSDAYAIPFFWRRTERAQEWTKSTFDFVPLIHQERKVWKDRQHPDDAAFKLWPLFGWRKEAGATDLKIPALLPMDIERFTEDFEANWSPFWELWHTHAEPDGSSRGNALFRLVDWEDRDDRSRFSLPLVYSLDHSPKRDTHDLLLGIVRFGTGQGGVELKLLGMPLLTPEVAPR